jgi:hypothetical protein
MATEYRNNAKVNVVTRRWRARTNLTPLRTQNYSAWRQASHLAACSGTPAASTSIAWTMSFRLQMGWTDSHLHQFLDAQLFTVCLQAITTHAWSGLTNVVFRLADVARHEKASFIYCSASGEAEHKLGAIRFSSRKELFRESGIKRVLFQYS